MSSQKLEHNYQFFMEADIGKYSDEWIVIVNGQVVFHTTDLTAALTLIKEKYANQKPLLYKVPGKESMIF